MMVSAEREGYAGCCEALADWDPGDAARRDPGATLVLAGSEDPATPPAQGEAIQQRIPGARMSILAGAGHLANLEQPEAFTRLLLDHLTTQPARWRSHELRPERRERTSAACRHAARCSAMRTSTRAVARTTDFTADFQEYITRNIWGDIWGRPGLDRRMRSAVTLTALIALGPRGRARDARSRRAAQRPDGRRDQGDSPANRRILRRPAANGAFAIAQAVLAEEGAT